MDTIIRQNSDDDGALLGNIYLDDAFTKQQLTDVLGQENTNPVLHIASHFKLRPGDSSHSFLLLGKNTLLTMAEVYQQNLNFAGADLVALSACDTAMGEQTTQSNCIF